MQLFFSCSADESARSRPYHLNRSSTQYFRRVRPEILQSPYFGQGTIECPTGCHEFVFYIVLSMLSCVMNVFIALCKTKWEAKYIGRGIVMINQNTKSERKMFSCAEKCREIPVFGQL